MNKRQKPIHYIDLFCGAGGLSAGFDDAGFRSAYANDYDENACTSYQHNHPESTVERNDVINVSGERISRLSNETNFPIIIGGPSCQGVSLRGNRDPNDPKNKGFFSFKRLIAELQPEWFVMENVPGLLHRHNLQLATDIFAEFEAIGYHCGGEVLLAADYGVPQLRYRFFLIGNRVGQPILFPNQTHRYPTYLVKQTSLLANNQHLPLWRSVRDAIADLPPIPNGGGVEEMEYPESGLDNLSDYQIWCRHNSDRLYNHLAHETSSLNIERIKYIPQGKNWKWIPDHLLPERFGRVAKKDHTTTYGRLEWDMPSRTITTYFNNISAGAFTHPEQHRGISIREGARLQSFPDHFRFFGSRASQYRQVGNAVPALLASSIAGVIYKLLSSASIDENTVHEPAIEYDRKRNSLKKNRPLKGMRFNLDQHLVTD